MQVKRYVAIDMRRALQQVREDLGADAVILSNRTIAEGIEVIASPHSKEELLEKWGHHKAIQAMSQKTLDIEDEKNDAQLIQATRVSTLDRNRIKKEEKLQAPIDSVKEIKKENKRKNHPEKIETSNSKPSFLDEMENLKGEVELLKELLKNQTTQISWGYFNYAQPLTSYLFKQISILGFSSNVAFDWLEQAKNYRDVQQAWDETLNHLTQQIPILDLPFSQNSNRIVALVGPTGAGKTTTLAKLAAQHILRQDKDSIALVTTDIYRIGAQEQLQTIGRIMDVPVRIADSPADLTNILRDLSDKSLVLVDTAGLTINDVGWQEQWKAIQSQESLLSILLVLPCSQQELVLKRVIRDFSNVHLTGCILTKIDEASSLGEVISLAMENKLSIAYVTDGLCIPDDIHLSDAKSIMNHAVNLAKAKNVEEGAIIKLFESYLNRNSKERVSISE